MDTVEVLETTTDVIEVIERGPMGPVGGLNHNPLVSLIAESHDEIIIPYHNGLEATEITVPFSATASPELDVTNGILSVLQDIDGFTATVEVHTTGSAPGGKNIQLTLWSEISTDAGVTWAVVPNSLHVDDVIDVSSGSHSFSISETLQVPAGTMMRVKMTKQGDATGTVLTLTPTLDLITSKGVVGGHSTTATMLYRKTLV